MARKKKITPEQQLEALASDATKQLALVDKRSESLIYALAKLGHNLLQAQQIHRCETVSHRPDGTGLFDPDAGFRGWFNETFATEDGGTSITSRTGYNYINAAKNILHLTRPEVDPADHHTLDITAIEEAEKKRLLKGWTLTDAYKSLPGPELPRDFLTHLFALYGATNAKDKAKAVWGKITRALDTWEADPSDPELAIPGYDTPPARDSETGLPMLWDREDFAAMQPAPADDDLTAAKTRLRPWLDDTERLVAELPHDKTLHFLNLEGDPDGLDLRRLLHTAQSLASHISETIEEKNKHKNNNKKR